MANGNDQGNALSRLFGGPTALLGTAVTLYWCLFWLFNGADKFFNEEKFYGVKFENLLKAALPEKLGISDGLAAPLAYIVGAVEVALGVVFLLALVAFIGRKASAYQTAQSALGISVVFFSLLTVGAILLGERGHVQTQAIVIGVLLVSSLVLSNSAKESTT